MLCEHCLQRKLSNWRGILFAFQGVQTEFTLVLDADMMFPDDLGSNLEKFFASKHFKTSNCHTTGSKCAWVIPGFETTNCTL